MSWIKKSVSHPAFVNNQQEENYDAIDRIKEASLEMIELLEKIMKTSSGFAVNVKQQQLDELRNFATFIVYKVNKIQTNK